jgi:beta-lactamase class A
MIVLNKFFNILHYKKMVPVLFLSCATLIGCSDSNTQSESPKQTKQTNQIKQENTG